MIAPYTLYLHLIGGQTVTLPCKAFEIVPGSMEEGEDGNVVEIPMRLDYTLVDGWMKTLGFLDFRGVVAIEVERSDEVIREELSSGTGDH